MQYKINDVLYMQLFTSHESSLKVSKFNCFSTENKYFKVFLVTAELWFRWYYIQTETE